MYVAQSRAVRCRPRFDGCRCGAWVLRQTTIFIIEQHPENIWNKIRLAVIGAENISMPKRETYNSYVTEHTWLYDFILSRTPEHHILAYPKPNIHLHVNLPKRPMKLTVGQIERKWYQTRKRYLLHLYIFNLEHIWNWKRNKTIQTLARAKELFTVIDIILLNFDPRREKGQAFGWKNWYDCHQDRITSHADVYTKGTVQYLLLRNGKW